MNVFEVPFGCHDPNGWLDRPDIAMQLPLLAEADRFCPGGVLTLLNGGLGHARASSPENACRE